MDLKHKAFDGTIDIQEPLKHRHVAAYEKAIGEFISSNKEQFRGTSETAAQVIQAALEAKIITQEFDIEEQEPWVNIWLSAEIVERVRKSKTVPKN